MTQFAVFNTVSAEEHFEYYYVNLGDALAMFRAVNISEIKLLFVEGSFNLQ